jgi:hypothetical protein
MKLNPDQVLRGLGGVLLVQPLPKDAKPDDKQKPWTVRDIAVSSLMSRIDSSHIPTGSGMEIYKRGKLAERIHDASKDNPATLTAEEVADIKERVAMVFDTAIVVAMWDIIDPQSPADE